MYLSSQRAMEEKNVFKFLLILEFLMPNASMPGNPVLRLFPVASFKPRGNLGKCARGSEKKFPWQT